MQANPGKFIDAQAGSPRNVVLFQRTHCPFPARFKRDNDEWKKKFDAQTDHRCTMVSCSGGKCGGFFSLQRFNWFCNTFTYYDVTYLLYTSCVIFNNVFTVVGILNIADVEAALTAAGFVVLVVDFGDKKWADYERVVKLVWSRWHLLV